MFSDDDQESGEFLFLLLEDSGLGLASVFVISLLNKSLGIFVHLGNLPCFLCILLWFGDENLFITKIKLCNDVWLLL